MFGPFARGDYVEFEGKLRVVCGIVIQAYNGRLILINEFGNQRDLNESEVTGHTRYLPIGAGEKATRHPAVQRIIRERLEAAQA